MNLHPAIDNKILNALEHGVTTVDAIASSVNASVEYVRTRLSLLVEDGSVCRRKAAAAHAGERSRFSYELR